MSVRLRVALHETRCVECRVTWQSWLARLLGVGGMEPKVCTCATPLRIGEAPSPCRLHGWVVEPASTESRTEELP